MKRVAVAHPNIALAKYWGKRDQGRNIPAVPSLSVTLGGMTTTTTVQLADIDALSINGTPQLGRPLLRASAMLDALWREAERNDQRPQVSIESRNDFPTAAGLASSASAFAALSVAGDAILDTGLERAQLSCIARRISASAGRSLYGGFVELPAGDRTTETLSAMPLAPAEHWDVRLVVAVTTEAEKEVGSTDGMNRTTATSPLYGAWVESAPSIFARVRDAVLAREFAALVAPVEQSALTMHASAFAADPGLVYWNGTTLEVIRAVRRLRAEGVPVCFTIDAGPHVKVLTPAESEAAVREAIAAVPGVLRTISARPGQGARVVSELDA
jgi:diphosphomevalonate decarboxylase